MASVFHRSRKNCRGGQRAGQGEEAVESPIVLRRLEKWGDGVMQWASLDPFASLERKLREEESAFYIFASAATTNPRVAHPRFASIGTGSAMINLNFG